MNNIIDWKKVSKSPGYRSLKTAYINDVQDANRTRQRGHKPMRGKAEFRKQFTKIINAAIRFSVRTGEPLESVLNRWETKRGRVWWMNYSHNMGAIPVKHRHPNLGMVGIRKWYTK